MKKIVVFYCLFISLLFVSCDTEKEKKILPYSKEYYKNIIENNAGSANIDNISSKLIDRTYSFVDLNTKISIPDTIVTINNQEIKYTLKDYSTLSESQVIYDKDDNKLEILLSEDNEESVKINFTDSNDNIFTCEGVNIADNIAKCNSSELMVEFSMDLFSYGNVEIIYNDTDNYAIIQNGDLGIKDFNSILDITTNYPNIKEIRLKNIDGSLSQLTTQTGLLLRKHGLNTKVLQTVAGDDTDIASGGVDLFTAGVLRNIEDGSKLGVHSWSSNEDGKEIQAKDYAKNDKAHHDQILYFSTMLGFEKGYEFYFFTINVAFDDNMHTMTLKEIEKYNFIKK